MKQKETQDIHLVGLIETFFFFFKIKSCRGRIYNGMDSLYFNRRFFPLIMG